jgi:hypothetical protein
LHEKTDTLQAAVTDRAFAAKPTYRGVVMVDINIRFPQVAVYGNPAVSQQISGFYRDSAKLYYDYACKELLKKAVKKYRECQQHHIAFHSLKAVQTYEKQYNHANHLSISCKRGEEMSADTWLLSAGIRLTLEDFFENSYYKSVFFNYITKEIQKQIDDGKKVYSDNFKLDVFRYFDEKNYYLTKNGISVFYPIDTIADHEAGIPVFTVPYENFGQSLKRNIFI